jgi:nucleoprotein TPR
MESERLQSLVLEKEVNAEICKKELEMQKAEIANLNQRISEVIFSPSSKIVTIEYHEFPLALLRTTMTFGPKQVRSKLTVRPKSNKRILKSKSGICCEVSQQC